MQCKWSVMLGFWQFSWLKWNMVHSVFISVWHRLRFWEVKSQPQKLRLVVGSSSSLIIYNNLRLIQLRVDGSSLQNNVQYRFKNMTPIFIKDRNRHFSIFSELYYIFRRLITEVYNFLKHSSIAFLSLTYEFFIFCSTNI